MAAAGVHQHHPATVVAELAAELRDKVLVPVVVQASAHDPHQAAGAATQRARHGIQPKPDPIGFRSNPVGGVGRYPLAAQRVVGAGGRQPRQLSEILECRSLALRGHIGHNL